MTETPQESKVEFYGVLSTEDLIVRRAEIANIINPLWLKLDAIDDELMARHREQRRARTLAPPPAFDSFEHAQPVGDP
jgi:hypothetical protein